ncbi:Regulatory protein uhpC [Serratia fonticola]|uniref:Regulatory protein uhpC n=1 Tax=Serratia fonticola TaxID=47917 RepID=A0A4U9TPB1_SERFO|nr:Regulatory protein uhpC [Serratia fonticola]
MLTSWYSRNERGFWWGTWNTSISLGGAAVPLLSGYMASHYGWQAALLLPGAIGMLIGLWLCWQLCGKPQQQGLPSVGHWRRDPLELWQEQQSPAMPMRRMLFDTILRNPTIWLLGVSYILVYLIRIALNDWGNIWLAESHGVNLMKANATLSLFELGGLFWRAVCRVGIGSAVSRPASTDDPTVFHRTLCDDDRPVAGPAAPLRAAFGLLFRPRLFCIWAADADRAGRHGTLP